MTTTPDNRWARTKRMGTRFWLVVVVAVVFVRLMLDINAPASYWLGLAAFGIWVIIEVVVFADERRRARTGS